MVNSAARISSRRRGKGPPGRFLILLHLVDPDVDLAPDPAFGAALLAGVPFALTLDLDPDAVDQQMQRTIRSTVGEVHLQSLLAPRQSAEVGHRPVQTDQVRAGLSTNPVVWRSAVPNRPGASPVQG